MKVYRNYFFTLFAECLARRRRLSVSWRSSVRDIATAIPMLSGDTLLPLNTVPVCCIAAVLQIRIQLDQSMQEKKWPQNKKEKSSCFVERDVSFCLEPKKKM
jgi:hypothetical protein